MKEEFHSFRYFVSTYFWFAIVFACCAIPLFMTHKNKMAGFLPKPYKTEWNLETDPITFVHFTDVHMNHVKPDNVEKFENASKWAQNVKPTWTVITGDLADDFPYTSIPKYAFQQKEDWDIYNRIIENYTRDVNFFDIAGNHDEFGVFAFDSDHHYYIKGRENLTVDEFKVSTLTTDYYNGNKLHMIRLSPYNWPSAHPPFVFWPKRDKQFLDLVEKELENISENDTVMFFCHYPLNLFENVKSSKGNTMRDIVEKPTRPTYFISGHLHPIDAFFQHQGNAMEAVGPALVVENNFGVFTLDHGRFVYSTVHNNDFEKYFITAPIPDHLLTPTSPFYEKTGYIRVRAITESIPNISVSGAVEGQMECRAVNTENEIGYVCSLPYTVENGRHTVNFHGDMEGKSLNFTIGVKTDDISEEIYKNSFWSQYNIVLGIVWVVVTIIVIPFPMKFSFIDEHEMFMVGQMKDCSWLKTIFGSFLLFKARVNRAPKWFTILLVVATLYPLCLPTSFIEIDGHPGVIFTYGYICDNTYYYALWGQIHTLFYVGFVLLPILLATCSLFSSTSFQKAFIFDILLCVGCIATLIFIILRFVCEAVGFLRTGFSPAFVLWPVALWICVGVLAYKHYTNPFSGEYSFHPLYSNI